VRIYYTDGSQESNLACPFYYLPDDRSGEEFYFNWQNSLAVGKIHNGIYIARMEVYCQYRRDSGIFKKSIDLKVYEILGKDSQK
jgi:hypothetical protein